MKREIINFGIPSKNPEWIYKLQGIPFAFDVLIQILKDMPYLK